MRGQRQGVGAPDEPTRLEQQLLERGHRYFTVSPPLRQLVGPLRYRVVIYTDGSGTRRVATLAGTYVEVLQALEQLANAP